MFNAPGCRPGAGRYLHLVSLGESIRSRERANFFREWLCVGREEEVPSPGSHRVLLDVLGESVILVRNRTPSCVRSTTCADTAARVCAAPTLGSPGTGAPAMAGGITASRIVCPYHQWTYDLDGHLLAAPLPDHRARLRQIPL